MAEALYVFSGIMAASSIIFGVVAMYEEGALKQDATLGQQAFLVLSVAACVVALIVTVLA